MEIRNVEKLYLQFFSAQNDGMHLELCMGDSEGKLVKGEPYPIVTIRADKGDLSKFVIYSEIGPISIPLAEIERAIELAKVEVHSEEYYDK